MKAFQAQLLRSARSSRLSRLSRLPQLLQIPNTRSAWAPATPALSKAERKQYYEELNMAKGPKFELKTPKGTKDCREPHISLSNCYTHFQFYL